MQPVAPMKLSASSSTKNSSETGKVVLLAGLGAILSVPIFALLCSAFNEAPNADAPDQCDSGISSSSSETQQTMMAFGFGWLVFYMLKNRDSITLRSSDAASRMMVQLSSVHFTCAKVISAADPFLRRIYSEVIAAIMWARLQFKNNGLIIFASFALLCCTVGVFASAFTATPDVEQPPESGLASESSLSVRIFTTGWILLLSLKLRQELVGHLGCSSLLQPF